MTLVLVDVDNREADDDDEWEEEDCRGGEGDRCPSLLRASPDEGGDCGEDEDDADGGDERRRSERQRRWIGRLVERERPGCRVEVGQAATTTSTMPRMPNSTPMVLRSAVFTCHLPSPR